MSKPDFIVQLYRGKRQGRQALRWRVLNAGNHKQVGKGDEAYTNKSDRLDTVTDLFSGGTTVHLVDLETGSQEVLREGRPPVPCGHCGHDVGVHEYSGCIRCECLEHWEWQ